MTDNEQHARGQITFLENLERLFLEGKFTATYKYALIISLADYSVRHGSDDNSELDVPIREIAERFIELYWRQTAPYGSGIRDGDSGILLQNTGGQAEVIKLVDELRMRGLSIVEMRKTKYWSPAVTKVASSIRRMPLLKLQKLGNENLEFLYAQNRISRDFVRLNPGVAANFRRFYGFVIRVTESEWLRFVQTLSSNAYLLGRNTDLENFLFGSDRARLSDLIAPLMEVQRGQCMYCGRTVFSGHVDHFIPWSRYPADLAHNLVLAHSACNQKKKDMLADESHLEKWVIRNETHAKELSDAGMNSGVLVDFKRANSVAAWAYRRVSVSGGAVWSENNTTRFLDGRWKSLLSPSGALRIGQLNDFGSCSGA
jgi:hypothetical protein